MNYLLNIYFNLRWQAKFRRGSNKKKRSASKKMGGFYEKNEQENTGARGEKEKNMGRKL